MNSASDRTPCSWLAALAVALALAGCAPGVGPGLGIGPDEGLPWLLGILVAVGVLAYVKKGTGSTHERGRETPASNLDRAQGILRKRYAKGDITRDEFLQARNDLQQDGHS
jgi:putative oligomerization/nucleic acid binding protein